MPIRRRSILAFSIGFLALAGAAGQKTEVDRASRGNRAQATPQVTPEFEVGTLALTVGNVDTATLPNLAQDQPLAFDSEQKYMIQLDGPMTPARRRTLELNGVILGDYFPAFAYVADLGDVDPGTIATLDFVAWVGVFRNKWKIAPGIGQREFASRKRTRMVRRGKVVLDVTLFERAFAADGIAALQTVAGLKITRIENIAGNETITVIVPTGQIGAIAALSHVQYIEEVGDVTLRNDSTRWIIQSNVNGQVPLHDAGLTGEGQIVGVLDGRVAAGHCSFFDNNPFGPNHRKIVAYNTSQGSDTHGTHVAGTAVGDAGSFTNTRGMAYLAKLAYNTVPSYTEAAIYARLQLHHSQGARLHTNSWGDDFTTAYNGLARGIDAFSYDFEDSLVFLAVTNRSTLKNPENAKNLLAVGASGDANSQSQHCSGGRGPTNDGRRKPEIYAPGCSTTSSRGSSCSTTQLTGTSMASPAVAGVGALVRQYFTDGYYPSGAANPSDEFIPTGALIKATLLNGSVDMTGVSGYPSNTEGWGRLLADESLHFSGEARTMFVDHERNADGLSTGEMVEHRISVNGTTERLRVTLVFTDPPAASGANFAAINDLDLEVVSPSGLVYRGNVFSGGQSTTGGSFDIRNNVEQVHRAGPEVGEWVVRIMGTAVNQGTQGYALVVSGAIDPVGSTVIPATLTDVTRTLGVHVSGGLPELLTSDDAYYVLQSGPGFNPTEPHPARADFGFDTGGVSAASLDVTLEEKANIGGPTAVLLIRNWTTAQWDELDRYAVSTADQTFSFSGRAATDYINGSNRIEVRVRTFAVLVLDPSIRGVFSHDFVGVNMHQ